MHLFRAKLPKLRRLIEDGKFDQIAVAMVDDIHICTEERRLIREFENAVGNFAAVCGYLKNAARERNAENCREQLERVEEELDTVNSSLKELEVHFKKIK